MTFKDYIKELSQKMSDIKEHIENETETKQSFINPLLKILGYDDTNPMEIKFEYGAAYGSKKDSRVDYAIMREGNPVIFIEAKSATKKLDNHDGQLNFYFNTTSDVKIGILTNGLEYKFFTDLNKPNMMDTEPFYQLNFENLTDRNISFLELFVKDSFGVDKVIGFASTLRYKEDIKTHLKDILTTPSDNFIKFILKDVGISLDLDTTKPLVEELLEKVILEISNKKPLLGKIDKEDINTDTKKTSDNSTDSVIEIIKSIISDAGKDITGIDCDKNVDYDTIYYKTVRNSWFIKVWGKGSNLFITTKLSIEESEKYAPGFSVVSIHPRHGNSKILIKSIDDMGKLKNLIIKSFEKIQI